MQKKQRERQDGRAARDDPGVLRERLDEALRRLREATPRAVSALRGLIPMPEGGGLEFDPDCDEPMMLPPQVTELLVRGDVTVTVGDPNVGKSQLLSATALAIAHDAVTELLGEPGDGWLGAALVRQQRGETLLRASPLAGANQEAAAGEAQETRQAHPLGEAAVRRTVRDSLLVPTEDGCEFVERLAARAEQGIHFAYIGLDPLSSLFRGINENDPPQTGDAVRFSSASPRPPTPLSRRRTTPRRRRAERKPRRRPADRQGQRPRRDHMSTFIALPEGEHKALGFPPDKLERHLAPQGRPLARKARRSPYISSARSSASSPRTNVFPANSPPARWRS